MALYGDNAIDEVRQRADIVEIIGAHVRLRRAGRNFVGLCPFHNEKTPSFSVNAERGFYHCFGCGAGGTVFNFMMKIEGLSFPEAIRSLATRYGVSLPELKNDGPAAAERDALTRANQTAAEFYAHVLWNTHDGELAREYLRARGITVETARAFMLGFSPARPASLAKALEKRGLTEAGIRAGVVKRDGMGLHDAFRARVMFPIRDAQGKVIAFGGRVLDARMPKYLNSPESPAYSKTRTLYGVHEARQAIASQDRVIIVEGYFDVIALWQAGFRETVASCGTSLTVEQLRLLSRYTKNVFACFDGDDAGRKASLRALEIFLQAGLLGRGIFIPSGFDPDTLVRERGAASLEELIGASELLVDYFMHQIMGREGTGSLASKVRAGEQIIEMLLKSDDPKLFEVLAGEASRKLGLGDNTMRSIVRSKRGKQNSSDRQSKVFAQRVKLDATSEAELGLVAIALLHPSLRQEIRESCSPELFSDPALATTFEELCALSEAATGFEEFIGERLSEDQRSRVAELAVGPLVDDPASAQKLVQDYTLSLSRRQIRREVDELKRDATSGSGPARIDDEAVANMLAVIELKKRDERGRRNAS